MKKNHKQILTNKNLSKVSQLVGGAEKTPFLESFCLFFVLFFAFSLTICIWNGVLQKKSVQWTFSSHRSVIYKVPPRIGGHHFLLCQQTNTKNIAG